jgi:hypothetical protein
MYTSRHMLWRLGNGRQDLFVINFCYKQVLGLAANGSGGRARTGRHLVARLCGRWVGWPPGMLVDKSSSHLINTPPSILLS